MLSALTSLPTTEFAAFALVAGIPLVLGVLAWPLLRSRSRVAPHRELHAESELFFPTDRGLPLQWSARCRQLEVGFEQQRAAMQLHKRAHLHLGALDHEIDRLWRDTRAVLEHGGIAG